MTITPTHLLVLTTILSIALLILRGGRWSHGVDASAATAHELVIWRETIARHVTTLQTDAAHLEKWQTAVDAHLTALDGKVAALSQAGALRDERITQLQLALRARMDP